MKILFTSIIGRPNTGKSSLLNQILNYDLSIVSKKPQATRNNVTGIYTDETHQIIFTDTPGIHKPQSKLGEHLNNQAVSSLIDIDLAIFLSPANEKIGPGDKLIISYLQSVKNKIAVMTKVDLETNVDILSQKANELKQLGFKDVFAISLKDNNSITQLIEEIKSYSYEGEVQYPEDYFTDVSEKFIARETIREETIALLHDEIPHSISIDITEFKDNYQEERLIKIYANIYVKKESQKGILIGKNGSMIKQIGIASRKAISDKLDSKVELYLKVKTNKNWINDENEIKKLGY
ncbi:GTP-binding protein Era [Mycoplasma testudineum]|uniref:GTPase Era n=1 Tax=Mycoplasma testudineum TaxID=244584 RepID=A0A4R6IDR4_9MOLU|nr:GTPase Era [Mycoplasma testudineum]OYD26662.1 GTPase Era [Mycoplasma testudineum]TDO19791.1 GTP-binding protein Era [Mycoplasma testudineum]